MALNTVCVCVCPLAYSCACVYPCAHVGACMHVYVGCLCECMNVYGGMWRVHACMCVYMYVCDYVCICVSVQVCVCVGQTTLSYFSSTPTLSFAAGSLTGTCSLLVRLVLMASKPQRSSHLQLSCTLFYRCGPSHLVFDMGAGLAGVVFSKHYH